MEAKTSLGGSPIIMMGCFLLAGVKEKRADRHVGSYLSHHLFPSLHFFRLQSKHLEKCVLGARNLSLSQDLLLEFIRNDRVHLQQAFKLWPGQPLIIA